MDPNAHLLQFEEQRVERISPGIRVDTAQLQTKHEDRISIVRFEHGTILAVFDGHYSSILSEYASETLPALLSQRISKEGDVEEIMKETIEEFDKSLLTPITALFEPGEDFSDPRWLDPADYIHPVIGGYTKEEPQFKVGRRAVVGTTALIAYIDKDAKHLWVASLGDSDAVLGQRKDDGVWVATLLSERHNCINPEEVNRLCAEHPNEDLENLIHYNRVCGALAVTRALGDHLMKAPRLMSARMLSYFSPSPVPPGIFVKWDREGLCTPPYLSSTPAVAHYEISPGQVLVLASDGLRDSLRVADESKLDVIVALATTGTHAGLAHPCIALQSSDNLAEAVIRNALFGSDAEERARQLDPSCERDDISVVVVSFGV
ncbi:protein serine threonine phosphatase 2C [Favolaschia claudopus]|uniref:Protein serine threonine phosphatase 2C n=1 Tax=Favolaschia claudopus TaxID=2862362 RepID=A0AAW0CK58_9AGAR